MMRVLIFGLLSFGFCYVGFAQESESNLKKLGDRVVVKDAGAVELPADKSSKVTVHGQDVSKPREAHEIDFEKAPHSVTPKQTTNTLSGENKIRQPFGYADTSGPSVELEKKQDKTDLTRAELLEKLGNPRSARSE